jgi:hypothetical protein
MFLRFIIFLAILCLSSPVYGQTYSGFFNTGTGGTFHNYFSTDSNENPPLWFSRTYLRQGTNSREPINGDFRIGIGYFENIHRGEGTHVYVTAHHLEQFANTGDGVALEASAWKYGSGHVWGSNIIAERFNTPEARIGALHGLEIGLENFAQDFGPMDTFGSPNVDIGLWLATGWGYPLTGAIGIWSAPNIGWYNGLWFFEHSIHPRGTAINMAVSRPLFGIKFGDVQPGGANIVGNINSPYREVKLLGGLFVRGIGNNWDTWPLLVHNNSGKYLFGIDNNGGGYLGSGGWYYASDKRLKKNVVYFNSGLNIINKLKPTKFDYVKGGKNQVGFIAQDIENILPASVKKNKEGMLSLKESDIIPYLVNAVKELSERVKILESKK